MKALSSCCESECFTDIDANLATCRGCGARGRLDAAVENAKRVEERNFRARAEALKPGEGVENAGQHADMHDIPEVKAPGHTPQYERTKRWIGGKPWR